MIYDDLLSVPYKSNGRDLNGMDCYGVVLECCRRAGLDLHDAVYADEKVDRSLLAWYVKKLNVTEVETFKANTIVQCEYDGRLHICFMVDKKNCIHATYDGVRISPVMAMTNRKYFEVNK